MTCQQTGDCSDIWAGAAAEPVETTHKGLISLDQLGFVLGINPIVRETVNHQAAAIRGLHRVVFIGGTHIVFVKEFVNVTGLREVDREPAIRRPTPYIVDAEIVGEISHEIDL